MSEFKLTEEEKEKLEEEITWCRENLRFLQGKLKRMIEAKDDLQGEISIWKDRFEKSDRRLAFATKLKVYKKGEAKKEKTVKMLESILEDKDKLKKFIALFENEGGEL